MPTGRGLDCGRPVEEDFVTHVRVRGIYATALTEHLRGEFTVVQPSGPIAERFDAHLPVAAYDVAVESSPDRQGVGLMGNPDGVAAVREALADLSRDTLSWRDPTPRGAILQAEVNGTRGRRAICDLGEREGSLPFDTVADHVVEGDVLQVQVHEPAPAWADSRPVVGEALRTFGGLVSLERGLKRSAVDAPPDRREELIRTLDLLDVDCPGEWVPRLSAAAADADLDAFRTAMERAADRARALDDAAGNPESGSDDGGDVEGGSVVEPEATAWVWFGREGRFALDDVRRAVVPTMAGHHRIKAGVDRASAAVDFHERVASPDAADRFPFDVVTQQFGPVEGDSIHLLHGKPDGRRFALGTGEVVDRDPDGTVTIRREMTAGGVYDALEVAREDGDVALTKITEGQWWYPTVYLDDAGERKGTYVNVCTPVEVFPDAAVYVDLHVDVIRHADGRVERVDDDELDEAVSAGQIASALAEQARSVAEAIERGLTDGDR